MRRWLVIFFLGLVGCQAARAFPLAALASFPASPAATIPATPSATATDTPTSTAPLYPDPGYVVRYHPDGPLFVGDQVSIEVIAPPGENLEGKEVEIRLGKNPQEILGRSSFSSFGLGQRPQATFEWVWDTSELSEGEYNLTFYIVPGGLTWSERIDLLPASALLSPEPQARWETVESECCVVHYITGTDAAQDLEDLLEQADAQADEAVHSMGIEFSDPITVTVLPRVMGHGGFAGDEIYISYLDENYAGNDFSLVLHHEMVHILDGRLGGEMRPSLLVEGMAVYLSGGHFKKEPLFPRAAALLDLGWYIPLASLADSFYTSQHEIGYLEGAALVQFLVNEYGWEAFDAFYRGITSHPSGKQSLALDTALQFSFGLSLAQLESRFVTQLSRQQRFPDMVEDVRLTITFYDTVRRYQQVLDPSAYFLTAWLPEGEQVRGRGIVADYLRHPHQAENKEIEKLLLQADKQLRSGKYLEANKTLSAANDLLDGIETNQSGS